MWIFGRKKKVKPPSIDYSNDILTAFTVMKNTSSDDHEAVIMKIASSGVGDEQLSLRLYQLVPIAFGRAMLKGTGVNMPDKFIIVDPATDMGLPRLFKTDQIYQQILKLIPKILKSGLSESQSNNLLMRSEEVRAVNEALQKGSDPRRLQLSPPVLY